LHQWNAWYRLYNKIRALRAELHQMELPT
jgi:hypothetical protein